MWDVHLHLVLFLGADLDPYFYGRQIFVFLKYSILKEVQVPTVPY
jgi:hypothetical protein